MTFHINQWNRRKNKKEKNHAKAGFWGWQRGEFEDTWDTHKSGYDHEFLEELLLRYNFIDIVSHEPITSKHLHYTFRKSKNA